MQVKHLYIHVPFCAKRCGYCDFAVHATRRPPVRAWLDGIETELRGVVEGLDRKAFRALETLYIGGGTPSFLGGGVMAELRSRIERYVTLDDIVEWTAEANPESFDGELARDWSDAGVNRISLGAQSFHEPTLRWLGRLHSSDGPNRAVKTARAAGIANVNIDLIFGLPERLERSWAEDMDRLLALEPDHVSLYGLTAETGTPLGRRVQDGRERLADERLYETEYLHAAERLAAAGLRHYEVSNFARRERESRHNLGYWSGAGYVGLGPGAHSYVPPRRYWNVRDWGEWRERVVEEGHAIEDEECLDNPHARLERIWLELRTDEGTSTDGLTDRQMRRIEAWSSQGWARVEGNRVHLTPRGWLLLDRLAVELDASESPPVLDGASSKRNIQAGYMPDAGLQRV